MADYQFYQKWSKILSLIACVLYVALGIARFFNVLSSINILDYIFNIYMM